MTTTTDVRPAAPPRASGSHVLETLANGGFALLLDRRVAPPRSFITVLGEHADGHALEELACACAEPVLVRDGVTLALPDGVAHAAVQLARLAGGCGEVSLAQVEDHNELPDLPAITLGGVGCVVDDNTTATAPA